MLTRGAQCAPPLLSFVLMTRGAVMTEKIINGRKWRLTTMSEVRAQRAQQIQQHVDATRLAHMLQVGASRLSANGRKMLLSEIKDALHYGATETQLAPVEVSYLTNVLRLLDTMIAD